MDTNKPPLAARNFPTAEEEAAVAAEPSRYAGPESALFLPLTLLLALAAGVAVSFAASQLRPVFFDARSLREASGLPLQRPDGKPLKAEYGDLLKKRIGEIGASLGNDAQKAAFDKASSLKHGLSVRV